MKNAWRLWCCFFLSSVSIHFAYGQITISKYLPSKPAPFAQSTLLEKTPDQTLGTTRFSKEPLPIANRTIRDSAAPPKENEQKEVFALVGRNNCYGFINKNGQEVVPIIYESIGQNFYEGLAAAKLGGKWGHVDKRGRVAVPFKYDMVGDFCEGFAFVKRNNKFGYVNKQGLEVIPLLYDEASSFQEGLAIVEQNGKKGFIDKNGHEVTSMKYDFVFSFEKENIRTNQ